MSDTPRRKSPDIEAQVRVAVIQAFVPYELRLGDIEKRQALLYRAVFGDELVPGLKKQVEAIDGKVDQLLEQQEARIADWKRMGEFLDREEERQVVMRAVAKAGSRSWKAMVAIAGLLGTLVGLVAGLTALGVIKW